MYPSKTKVISCGVTEGMKVQNRKLHWGQRGVVNQHDPRHVDVLVKHLRLERGNSLQTSARDVTDEEPVPLDQMQSSQDQDVCSSVRTVQTWHSL